MTLQKTTTTTAWHRRPILSHAELPADQQAEQEDQDDSYVESPLHPGEYLPLGHFMWSNGRRSRFHAFNATSYFDGFGVVISRDGEEALVAHVTW